MLVSVVICTYKTERLKDLNEAIDSVFSQTFSPIEVVVVVDGNNELYEMLKPRTDIVLVRNLENLGLSRSRNNGARAAHGDIIVFFDDDAVAHEKWIESLVQMYTQYNAISAGGKIIPLWMDGEVNFIPNEYLFLIGGTHRGFVEHVHEVRNTFGSNLSFLRDVFLDVGGFEPGFGFAGNAILQGEEADLCARMRNRYGKGVMYNPQAAIYHKVFKSRTKVYPLLKRAFWQGYSKRLVKERATASLTEEGDFLKMLLLDRIPRRLEGLLRHPSKISLVQLTFLAAFTAAIGSGFLYRIIEKQCLRCKSVLGAVSSRNNNINKHTEVLK